MSSFLPQRWEHFKDLLRFSHAEVEASLQGDEDITPGLSESALYTDLEDFAAIFSHHLVRGTFVDLGTGTGISALLYALLFPERKSVGVEKVPRRLEVGRRLKEKLALKNVELLESDLLEMPLPEGDTFFLYFPTGSALDRVLDLLAAKREYLLVAIESHGDLFPRLDLEPSLQLVASQPVKAARHHPDIRFYGPRKVTHQKEPLLSLSYQHKYLVIEEDSRQRWVAESFGLQWCAGDRFNLQHPPRTIHPQQVVGEFKAPPGELVTVLLALRPHGDVTINTARGAFSGKLRKIQIFPANSVELSGGELLEWEDIQSLTWNGILCYESSSHLLLLPPALSAANPKAGKKITST